MSSRSRRGMDCEFRELKVEGQVTTAMQGAIVGAMSIGLSHILSRAYWRQRGRRCCDFDFRRCDFLTAALKLALTVSWP
jgi:hypothetical protein